MKREEMAALLDAYRDGDIAEADAGRLAEVIRERGEASRQVLGELETDGLIGQALDHTDSESFVRGFWERHRAEQDGEHFVHDFEEKRAGDSALQTRTRTRRAWITTAAAVCVVALLAVAGRSWLRPHSHAVAHLQEARGEVFIIRGGVDQRIDAASTALRSGDGFRVTGEESFAAIVFADGTRLEFGEDTVVTHVAEDRATGKRVVLSEGFFTASVAKQPAGKPMVLATPNSEVVVLGTTFSLSVGTAVTHLETQSGNVRLKRSSDGRSVEVPAGFDAIVANGSEPLVAQPLAPRSDAARLQREGCWTAALSPEADALAVTRYVKGDVEIWDTTPKANPSTFRAHDKRVTAAVFTRDGKTLITGSMDGTVKMWDRATSELKSTLAPGVGEITALALSADGRSLTILSLEGQGESRTLSSWHLESRKPRWSARQLTADRLALSPDGSMLATVRRQDRFVTVWDLVTGEVQATLRAAGDRTPALLRIVFSMAFSHDGRTLAVDDVSGLVSLWDIDTGEVKSKFRRHGGRIFGMGFSPDDRLLATGQQDDTIRIWDISSAAPVAAFAGHKSTQTRDVAFADDGRTLLTRGIRLATGGRPRDGIVQLWDLPATVNATNPR
jgi:ferric-dicitrate binding protein FerR (iron transport regulator)